MITINGLELSALFFIGGAISCLFGLRTGWVGWGRMFLFRRDLEAPFYWLVMCAYALIAVAGLVGIVLNLV